MKARAVLVMLLGATLVAGTASADGETNAGAAGDRQWFGTAGAVFGDGHSGAFIGGTFLVRRAFLAAGAALEAGGDLTSSRYGAAATAGFSLRGASGFGADLLGGSGAHGYRVGGGMLSDDPGTSATLPYVSARLRGVYVFGKRARHFQLGLGGSYDHDLSRVTHTYSYTETPWLNIFGDEKPSTRTVTHSIGSSTFAVTVDAGMTFDAL